MHKQSVINAFKGFDTRQRASIACRNSPPTLAKLSSDRLWWIRLCVAQHKNTPQSVYVILIKDSNLDVALCLWLLCIPPGLDTIRFARPMLNRWYNDR